MGYQKKYTNEQLLAEVKRETRVRKRVYPNWIHLKKLTKTLADKRIGIFEQLAELLEERIAQEKKNTPTLFDQGQDANEAPQ